MKTNNILIYHHLGMGDMIECNGMVRHFAEKYNIVDIFAKEKYYDSCKFMYKDNKRIVINTIRENKEYGDTKRKIDSYNGHILIPGHQNYFNNLDYFKKLKYGPAQSFYHIANVPWKYRNEKFFFLRDVNEEERVLKKLNPMGEKFVFVHDDSSRGHHIQIKTKYKVIKNDPTENLFSMIGILEAAEEVHCMSSSFLCLIDCLGKKINIKKKFLHKSVRGVELGPNDLFSDWIII